MTWQDMLIVIVGVMGSYYFGWREGHARGLEEARSLDRRRQ
jgi:hypothetical protein